LVFELHVLRHVDRLEDQRNVSCSAFPGQRFVSGSSQRRYNPLRREWVLVSPQRTSRPWQGQIEHTPRVNSIKRDPLCYLCPGNERAGGRRNPEYTSTFVFDNDFPALSPTIAPEEHASSEPLFVSRPERGICRVVCFSPRHDLTFSRLGDAAVREVIDTWIAERESLAKHAWVGHIQIFENRGEMMGASNPHPHGQIWATESVPDEPAKEREALREYRDNQQRCLLCDYVRQESDRRERVVCGNELFVAVVPFWAVWPYETMVLSTRHFGAINELSTAERDALSDILRRLTTQYDSLFQAPFPYSMGFHETPLHEPEPDIWHFHAHFYPPLLRSATIRKFMVGFELLGSPQRDLTPEETASRLRKTSDTH
jgi:UDPglucose--hexose-1-phosphate uridylyltransferase